MLRKRRPGLGRPGETRLSDGAPDPEALETRPSDAGHAAAADPTQAQALFRDPNTRAAASPDSSWGSAATRTTLSQVVLDLIQRH